MKRRVRFFGLLVAVCCVFCCVSVGASGFGKGRIYEMVSPVFKGGFGALNIVAVAQDGETVMFYSPGTFAGAPSGPETLDYVSRRGPVGWVTAPLAVPAALMSSVYAKDVSPTLGTELAVGKPGGNEGEAFQVGTAAQVMLYSTALPDESADWELAGNTVFQTFPQEPIVLRYEDGSPDFCHVLVSPAFTGAKENVFLSEEAEKEPAALTQVYDFNRGCGGERVSLRIVGLNNRGKVVSPSCTMEVGTEGNVGEGSASKFNAVADDGKEVFFTTCVGESSSQHQLFVRLDDLRTLEVSRPLSPACSEVPCTDAPSRANADFVGASEDGSRVFFTTTAPLDAATDTDSGNDLYMATIGCPAGEVTCGVSDRLVTSLVQISHDPNGGEAGVQGVVRLAPDGSHAYFVAQGDLLDTTQQKKLEGEGRAVPQTGADNLYAYDSTAAQVGFIGALCGGSELSGVVEDTRCPSTTGSDAGLWIQRGEIEAQTSGPDGRFLVFTTFAQLAADDTDAAKDVYRYDALTGALERISVGEDGSHANGNDSRFDASIPLGNWGGDVQSQYQLGNRAISEDGSRVIFTSSEPLSSAAVNGLVNAYEWHEGSVSLVSSGNEEEPVEDVMISPEGRDVFFVTTQGLVSQDTDGAPDVYDARVDGGFPVSPAPREPCSSDACQGPLTNPVPLLVPGSVSQAPGENFAPAKTTVPSKAKKTKAAAKKKKKKRKKRKVKAKEGRAAHVRRLAGKMSSEGGKQ